MFFATMIYTHVLNKSWVGICSPLDDDGPAPGPPRLPTPGDVLG